MTMQKGGSEGGRGGYISHTHIRPCMAIPGKPSARLTRRLKLVTRQRFLRFSILKETPTGRHQLNDPPCVQREIWDMLSLAEGVSG